ncbi:hypothetical protein EVAR_64773_1 [Eumeta japonica]|uniref:Uncharacterized protein n=1 Tax=Eumeta variegata TaxID=151549 RepID=A0A4C1ZG00_EUMVA|nr:hypothetical protein EVAR_64773_1 [Eumeta japonica]
MNLMQRAEVEIAPARRIHVYRSRVLRYLSLAKCRRNRNRCCTKRRLASAREIFDKQSLIRRFRKYLPSSRPLIRNVFTFAAAIWWVANELKL